MKNERFKPPHNTRHEEEPGLTEEDERHPLVVRDHLTGFIRHRHRTLEWHVVCVAHPAHCICVILKVDCISQWFFISLHIFISILSPFLTFYLTHLALDFWHHISTYNTCHNGRSNCCQQYHNARIQKSHLGNYSHWKIKLSMFHAFICLHMYTR